jgi:hypothetical protein
MVGTQVPAGSTVKFNIGRGGEGGGALNIPGDGFNSVATYTQLTSGLYNPVGAGGRALASSNATGGSPGNLTVNGYTYTGGVGGSNNGTGPGTPGGAPGAGGGGGAQQAATQLGGAGGHGIALHAGQRTWEANYGKQEELLYTFLLQMESDGKLTEYAAPVLEELKLKYGE